MGIRSVFVVIGVFFTTLSGFAQSPYFGHIFPVLPSKNQSANPDTIDAREALLLSVNGGLDSRNIPASRSLLRCSELAETRTRILCPNKRRGRLRAPPFKLWTIQLIAAHPRQPRLRPSARPTANKSAAHWTWIESRRFHSHAERR